MPYDKTKQARKNFCFVTFEREETMKELLKQPRQRIREVEVIRKMKHAKVVSCVVRPAYL